MPTNKRESLLFTFIMCFLMVLWMSIYNVTLLHGGFSADVLAQAWLGFPPAYIFAMLCDMFVAGPLAKGVAFKLFVKPGQTSPRATVLIVSSCMVVPMVTIMSLYGAFEASLHMPGGIVAALPAIPFMWVKNIGMNFIMALPWNLLVAGPIARGVFRRAFPIGTVLAESAAHAPQAAHGAADLAAAPASERLSLEG